MPHDTTPADISVHELAELNGELDAFREGMGQLAYDKPHKGQPLHTEYDWHSDEPRDYLQFTYRTEPAWSCMVCLKVNLGVETTVCAGCGNEDLTPMLHGPVFCRALGDGYDAPCLVLGHDGCQCPDETGA